MTDFEKLEEMIDRRGIQVVIETLGAICSEKADHIRENWQDEKLADHWDREAAILVNTWSRFEDIVSQIKNK